MLKTKMKTMWLKKDPGGKEIIVEIGLAVIAIALLLIFKTGISGIIESFVTDMGASIKNMFAGIK